MELEHHTRGPYKIEARELVNLVSFAATRAGVTQCSPSLLRSRSGRSHATLPVPTRLLQTDIHSFLFVLCFCLLRPMKVSFSCHCIRCTNHRENPCRHSSYGMGETPLKNVVESSNKCFICSSIPISKNRVYLFDRTSTDLAGIIRSSLEFDVKKYHKNSNLFVC